MTGFFARLLGRDADPQIPGMVTGASRSGAVPPQPATGGTATDPELRRAMYQSVLDDCWLSELPYGDFEHQQRPGSAKKPFDPADCSALLLRWFDAGLIELHQDVEPPEDALGDPAVDLDYDAVDLPLIPPITARALLAAPERWTDDSTEGWAVPVPTERGRSTPADRWT